LINENENENKNKKENNINDSYPFSYPYPYKEKQQEILNENLGKIRNLSSINNDFNNNYDNNKCSLARNLFKEHSEFKIGLNEKDRESLRNRDSFKKVINNKNNNDNNDNDINNNIGRFSLNSIYN
jgi:hypothetical protein